MRERRFKWLWTWWGWLLVPDELLVWVFHSLLSCWDFHHIKAICRLYRDRTRENMHGRIVEQKEKKPCRPLGSESAQHTNNLMQRLWISLNFSSVLHVRLLLAGSSSRLHCLCLFVCEPWHEIMKVRCTVKRNRLPFCCHLLVDNGFKMVVVIIHSHVSVLLLSWDWSRKKAP